MGRRLTRRGIIRFALVLLLIVLAASVFFILGGNNRNEYEAALKTPPEMRFGFEVDSCYFIDDTIRGNQVLGDILPLHGVPFQKLFKLENISKEIYDIRNLRAGQPYSMIKFDSLGPVECFAFSPSSYRYVVYDFRDSVSVYEKKHEIETRVEMAIGSVKTSLWNSMIENNLDISLIDIMEDALGYSVDFFHAQVGDVYKLIYEVDYVGGKRIAPSKILGAYYYNGRPNYSIYFDGDTYSGYYDKFGFPAKMSFLRSPLKFSRISSRFSLNRFHPIHHRNMPHYGTDYAAPRGTPIRSVANGTVIERAYKKNNGNYVTIRHAHGYETRYFHMSAFPKGLYVGSSVSQGETIGYVGSTGLATGNHVCFRMSHNGRPIDHLKENFPNPDPLPQEELDLYFIHAEPILEDLDFIGFDCFGTALSLDLKKDYYFYR